MNSVTTSSNRVDELSWLAKAWGVPENTLRERIDQLGREIEEESLVIHIALERFVANMLTEEDEQHLDEGCTYCAELQRAVSPPTPDRVEVFVQMATPTAALEQKSSGRWMWAAALPFAAAILLLIALPAYHDYSARSQISSIRIFLDGIRTWDVEHPMEASALVLTSAKCGAAEKSQSAREQKEEHATAAVNKVDFHNAKNAQLVLKSAISDFCAAGKPDRAFGVSAAIMVANQNPSQAQAYLDAVKRGTPIIE